MTLETLRLTEALIARPSITPEDGGCQALLAERLRDPMLGIRVAGYFDDRGAGRLPNLPAAQNLGELSRLADYARMGQFALEGGKVAARYLPGLRWADAA